MKNELIEKIKELKRALAESFPGGGISITITASLDNAVELSDGNVTPAKTETAGKKTKKKDTPALVANTPENLEEVRKMLNFLANKLGAEKAFEFVTSLTGGSKKADDIPADKWSDVLALYMEVSSDRAA